MSHLLEKIFAVFALIVFLTILINHGQIKFDIWDKAVDTAHDAVESEQGQEIINETKETSWNVLEIFVKKFKADSEAAKEKLNEKENEESTSNTTPVNDNIKTGSGAVNEKGKLLEASLVTVVDGDTLILKTNDREDFKVRLIGIDTPESVHSDEEKNNEFGVKASDYTKMLLENTTTLFLQYDVSEKDNYDRDLCYVWLKSDVDTSSTQDISAYMLNGILLRNGYAYDKVYTPNIKYADVFWQLREEAENTKAGLWQYPGFADLWNVQY